MPPAVVTGSPAMYRAIDLVTWTAPPPSSTVEPDPLRAETVFEELQAFFADDASKARTGEKADLSRLQTAIERSVSVMEASDALVGLACATPARTGDPVALH